MILAPIANSLDPEPLPVITTYTPEHRSVLQTGRALFHRKGRPMPLTPTAFSTLEPVLQLALQSSTLTRRQRLALYSTAWNMYLSRYVTFIDDHMPATLRTIASAPKETRRDLAMLISQRRELHAPALADAMTAGMIYRTDRLSQRRDGFTCSLLRGVTCAECMAQSIKTDIKVCQVPGSEDAPRNVYICRRVAPIYQQAMTRRRRGCARFMGMNLNDVLLDSPVRLKGCNRTKKTVNKTLT